MSALIQGRVLEHLQRLRLGFVADRLDALLAEAARREPTYLDFLDDLLRQEVEAKQRKRIAMGVQIAHFPSVKTLDDFEFKFQPSIDHRLVRELATGRFIALAENVLIFGPPGVGKTAPRDRLGTRRRGDGAQRVVHERDRAARRPGQSRKRGAARRAVDVLRQAQAARDR